MIENENTGLSLLNEQQETNPQAHSDEKGSLLNPENKEQNAFQAMQKQINSYKSELEKVTKEFEIFKSQQSTDDNKTSTTNDSVISEVTKVLNNFKADFEGKLDNISKSFQQQEVESKAKQLDKVLTDFKDTYGLTGWQLKNFVNAMDVSGSGFDNTFEGKTNFLMKYADTPKIIEMELIKVSPKDIQTALDNKQKLNAKTVNKQQTATVRAGEFNTNPANNKTTAENKVKEFLNKETQKVELKITGKAF